MKRPKYNNIKTVVDGITFDSKAEAKRYQELNMLWKAGEVRWFTRQPSFLLPGSIRYRPDFMVCDNAGKMWCEDVKGMETPAFKIKRKLWDDTFRGLPLKVVKR